MHRQQRISLQHEFSSVNPQAKGESKEGKISSKYESHSESDVAKVPSISKLISKRSNITKEKSDATNETCSKRGCGTSSEEHGTATTNITVQDENADAEKGVDEA